MSSDPYANLFAVHRDRATMTSENIFQQRAERFSVSVDHTETSYVWKYFGILSYEEDGKRRSVSNQYFCKECLNKAIATDGKAPFNKWVLTSG